FIDAVIAWTYFGELENDPLKKVVIATAKGRSKQLDALRVVFTVREDIPGLPHLHDFEAGGLSSGLGRCRLCDGIYEIPLIGLLRNLRIGLARTLRFVGH